jgi:uncharacterized protein (DUF2132 family)
MSEEIKNKNNPLHGVKLQDILEALVKEFGYKELARRIEIRCFQNEPNITSCLKFLRKTPWARTKVEDLYVNTMRKKNKEA